MILKQQPRATAEWPDPTVFDTCLGICSCVFLAFIFLIQRKEVFTVNKF